jgi:hypothetical protein
MLTKEKDVLREKRAKEGMDAVYDDDVCICK